MGRTYHQGRLLDHVHLRVRDLEASRAFYRAVFGAIEKLEAWGENEDAFWLDEFYVDRADESPSRIHLAFQASSRSMVDRFHTDAVAAGGHDHGAPGERGYHSSYYAAFVIDPDGNNIEVVCDAPTARSADSVEVTRL